MDNTHVNTHRQAATCKVSYKRGNDLTSTQNMTNTVDERILIVRSLTKVVLLHMFFLANVYCT